MRFDCFQQNFGKHLESLFTSNKFPDNTFLPKYPPYSNFPVLCNYRSLIHPFCRSKIYDKINGNEDKTQTTKVLKVLDQLRFQSHNIPILVPTSLTAIFSILDVSFCSIYFLIMNIFISLPSVNMHK